MASIHTMFATKMLQDVIGLSLFKEVSAVLIIFGFVEIVFFIFIRSLYMQNYHNTRVDKIFKTNLMKRVFYALLIFTLSGGSGE